MAVRKCSGCGAEMGWSDTYCRICGRIQMPRREPSSEGERFGVGTRLLWMIVALTVLALVAWLIVKLQGI